MMDAGWAAKANAEDVLKKLKTTDKGLSAIEAEKRLSELGYNEIKERKHSPLLLFVKKFYGPVPLLLIVVLLLSYALGHFADFYIILALLIFNAVISFLEEYRADKSIELLKQRLSPTSRVLRSGRWILISSRNLVQGDIVRVRSGDIIPADSKILESEAMEADESAITGESLPVDKNQGDILYEGSVAKRGEATCVVIGTGASTLYGKTATLVENAKPKYHTQEIIMGIMRYLIIADIIVIAIMFGYGVLALNANLGVILPLLLVIFISSVPVALPAAFTTAMALGTEVLSKKNILVRRLGAMEDAATMDVLCMDKTGTLTKNEISVKDVEAFSSKAEDVVRYAADASRKEDNDPIDIAVLSYAIYKKVKPDRQLSYSPFDPSTKRTEAEALEGKKRIKVAKGAVQIIANMCKMTAAERKRASDVVEGYSAKGYRSIAVASNSGAGYRFAGILALRDEPRKDASALISELRELGIKPKMLTGDNIAVAKQVSYELGIGDKIVDASEFSKQGKESYRKIAAADGFANIYPEDKYTIVSALQKRKNITGMTGDGINDAPALKQAEVGIAVSNATDVAKSSAALVLTKDGIGVIVDAVKESRKVFERMITYTMTKISRIFQIVVFVAILYITMHGFIAITPFLLILLIFTNDIANISVSTDNVGFSKSPDVWNMKAIVGTSAIIGVMLMAEGMALLPFINTLIPAAAFPTAIFLLFDVSDKFTLFNFREKRQFWRSTPSKWLLAASIVGITAGTILAYYGILMPRLSSDAILLVFEISFISIFINDIAKVFIFKKLGVR